MKHILTFTRGCLTAWMEGVGGDRRGPFGSFLTSAPVTPAFTPLFSLTINT